MPSRKCSSEKESELVRRFAARVDGAKSDPRTAISLLLKELCKSAGWKPPELDLQRIFDARRIVRVELDSSLECDGMLRPVGHRFEDGFRLALKAAVPIPRARFTVAHEICHTFFYELVPEWKFFPHQIDIMEERLCNFGAAELLMPAARLRRQAKKLGVSLQALDELSSLWSVSKHAMLVRLRSLGLWDCELSVWHYRGDGSFFLQGMVGARKVQWNWFDIRIPDQAWQTGRTLRGHTFVEYKTESSYRLVKAVSYEIQRRGDSLIALWSRTSLNPQRKLPLLQPSSA